MVQTKYATCPSECSAKLFILLTARAHYAAHHDRNMTETLISFQLYPTLQFVQYILVNILSLAAVVISIVAFSFNTT